VTLDTAVLTELASEAFLNVELVHLQIALSCSKGNYSLWHYGGIFNKSELISRYLGQL